MADQTLIAEIYGYLTNGITEGGETVVTKLYEQFEGRDSDFPDPMAVESLVSRTIELIFPFKGQRIVRAPHFLMIVAVLGYIDGTIKSGRIDTSRIAAVPKNFHLDVDFAQEGLGELNEALDGVLHGNNYDNFIEAASSSTQRIKSRQIRFEYIYKAIVG